MEGIKADVIRQGPTFTVEQDESLFVPVSDIETQDVIFDVGEDKSSGHDEYSLGFFMRTWSVVGNLVREVSWNSFRNGPF